jgi:hypothetical protein
MVHCSQPKLNSKQGFLKYKTFNGAFFKSCGDSQILGLSPLSQTRKYLRWDCAQIATPQLCSVQYFQNWMVNVQRRFEPLSFALIKLILPCLCFTKTVCMTDSRIVLAASFNEYTLYNIVKIAGAVKMSIFLFICYVKLMLVRYTILEGTKLM